MDFTSQTSPSTYVEAANDLGLTQPFSVDDWTDLRHGYSVGTRQWLYFRSKYVWERVVAGILLVPASVVILLLCGLVRATSRGNPLYVQTRVGLRGKPFSIIKIRTMRNDAELDGKARWCKKNDPRITPLGRWIRKLHLDELPQLINVVRGEMTLVGPRPERPEFVKDLAERIDGYERRLMVIPGITGLAQINLPPDENDDDVRRKLILDVRYIQEACFWLDFRMLLASSVRLLGVPGIIVTKMLGLSRTHCLPKTLEKREVPVESLGYPATIRRPTVHSSQHSTRKLLFAQNAVMSTESVPLPDEVPNALTVDVEDYFQVSAFEHRVPREQWGTFASRVEANTDRLLTLFEEKRVKGTFFVLGWIAEKHPSLIRRIAEAGHEIGCHSHLHRLIYEMSPGEFREDLIRSREAIYNACGVEAKCFRAPSFSITARSLWAISALVEEGFTVDSSIFPIVHDRYGIPNAPTEVHYRQVASCELIEFPPTVWQSKWGRIPVGGGYFRLMPYWLTRQAIAAVREAGRPAMFYVHPWEIDPGQPRIAGVGWLRKSRHFVGQSTTLDKLCRLLDDHRFGTVSQVLAHEIMGNVPPEGALTESKSPV